MLFVISHISCSTLEWYHNKINMLKHYFSSSCVPLFVILYILYVAWVRVEISCLLDFSKVDSTNFLIQFACFYSRFFPSSTITMSNSSEWISVLILCMSQAEQTNGNYERTHEWFIWTLSGDLKFFSTCWN